ncbi:MAG: hypothetical protein HRU19_21880 [Pseudobacteriovorax sp.]|nr:hypothetical protein [Pseudobacteriovorax sp.]
MTHKNNIRSIIVITGPDGSGKSTLVNSICKINENFEPVSAWSQLSQSEFSSKEEVDQYIISLGPAERYRFITKAIESAITNSKAKKTLLIDGYWYKYAISESFLGLPLETAAMLVNHLPKPSLTLNLQMNPELAVERKSTPSRYEQLWMHGIDPSIIASRWHVLSGMMNHWLTIESSQKPEQVLEEAIGNINEFFGREVNS